MKVPPKCFICKKHEAEWAMQYLDEKPSFYFLGSHIRGFKVYKVCDECRKDIKSGLIIVNFKQEA